MTKESANNENAVETNNDLCLVYGVDCGDGRLLK